MNDRESLYLSALVIRLDYGYSEFKFKNNLIESKPMSATTIAFAVAATTSTPSTTVEHKPSLECQMRAALEHARRLTAMNGHYNREVAIAWEVVEELQFAQRQQQATVQSAFAQYCFANPDAPEARMYDV
jgi:hypothetical protein